MRLPAASDATLIIQPPAESASTAPIPLADAEESFELETSYATAPTVVGMPWPEPPQASSAPAPEASDQAPAVTLPSSLEPSTGVDELTSPTLAELYFTQGFTDKAIAVYRQLLEREPGNERAGARLAELQAIERHLRAEEARYADTSGRPLDPRQARREAIERTIARLEGLLSAIRRE
jgi:hypothetical protein